jgi:hypothetical protein
LEVSLKRAQICPISSQLLLETATATERASLQASLSSGIRSVLCLLQHGEDADAAAAIRPTMLRLLQLEAVTADVKLNAALSMANLSVREDGMESFIKKV